MIEEIINGQLDKAQTTPIPHFNIQVPKAVKGIPDDLLHPGWDSKIEYAEELATLAIKFNENYAQKHKGKLGNIEEIVFDAKPKV